MEKLFEELRIYLNKIKDAMDKNKKLAEELEAVKAELIEVKAAKEEADAKVVELTAKVEEVKAELTEVQAAKEEADAKVVELTTKLAEAEAKEQLNLEELARIVEELKQMVQE